MKALTLYQPWASLVALGLKKIETRSYPTKVRGHLAIHAGKNNYGIDVMWRDPNLLRICQRHFGQFPKFPIGKVLCIVDLQDCVSTNGIDIPFSSNERVCGDFGEDRFAWKFKLIETFDKPIKAVGSQGFWNWDGSYAGH